jgi:hypothetical protein
MTPDGPVRDIGYHQIISVETAIVDGMAQVDDRMTTVVGLHLWVLDLPPKPLDAPHGQFVLEPDHAEQLGHALIAVAAEARKKAP